MKANIKIINQSSSVLELEAESTIEQYALVRWKEENQIAVPGSIERNQPETTAIPFDKIIVVSHFLTKSNN